MSLTADQLRTGLDHVAALEPNFAAALARAGSSICVALGRPNGSRVGTALDAGSA